MSSGVFQGRRRLAGATEPVLLAAYRGLRAGELFGLRAN
jgi:hypothetical protein